MFYPGDFVPLLLSLAVADGSDPNVTSAPVVSILSALDLEAGPLELAAGVTTGQMALVPGSEHLYQYLWNTGSLPDGTYIVLVSYVAGGLSVSGRFLTALTLGDSRVTGPVALDATVAKDLTVAKDATVLKAADFVAPADDASVIAIKAKIDTLPENVASEATLTQLASQLGDLHDAEFGTWHIDKTSSPNVLTLTRQNGELLKRFDLIETTDLSRRAPRA